MKLFRNLDYVRQQFGRFEPRIVPDHVYRTLAPYAEDYEAVFGRPLSPADTDRPAASGNTGDTTGARR